jgi:hypothetical protein
MAQAKTLLGWRRSLISGKKQSARKALDHAVSFAVESLEQRRMLSVTMTPPSAETPPITVAASTTTAKFSTAALSTGLSLLPIRVATWSAMPS